MAKRTYYEVLEIPKSAPYEEIHTSYRRLLKEYHPDRVPEHLKRLKSDAEERLKEINEAWAVLRDSAKRQEYDAGLNNRHVDHSSEQASEDEVSAIIAEMLDVGLFLALCRDRPEEALGRISKLESRAAEMADNPSVILFRAIALAHRILKTRAHAGELPDWKGNEESRRALSELLRARKVAMSEKIGSVAVELEPLIDEVAIILETSSAGSVQEVMGTTKLKYLGLADRIKVTGDWESRLTPDEVREIMEMPIKTPFIIRSALVNPIMPMSGRKTVIVMLYERQDMWGPTGKIIASKGMLTFEKDDSPLGRWRLQITSGGAVAEPSQPQSKSTPSVKVGSDPPSEYRRRLFWWSILPGGLLGLLLFTFTPDGPARNGITIVAVLVAIVAAIVLGAQLKGWGGGIAAYFAANIAFIVIGAISALACSAGAWATISGVLSYTCAGPLYAGQLARKRGPLYGVALGGLVVFAAIVVGGITWSPQRSFPGSVQQADPSQTVALPPTKTRRQASVQQPKLAANSQKPKLAPLETGTVSTCADVRGWKDYTPKNTFHPGEALCVYAEALNVNQDGHVDVSYLAKILGSNGTTIAQQSDRYSSVMPDTCLWHRSVLPLPQFMPQGTYTAIIDVRNNLTGQTGRGSTTFTVISDAATSTPPPVNKGNDSVTLEAVDPQPGTYLTSGKPVTFNIRVRYNLVSADTAILSISTAQLRDSSEGCHGTAGELPDAVEVPILRGTHETYAALTWSGDTGSATSGRVFGRGYVSFSPMFWASNSGHRAELLKHFGIYSDYCYQFGKGGT